jgi:hypothetical protein
MGQFGFFHPGKVECPRLGAWISALRIKGVLA